jgi:hypothetical protein
VQRIIQFPRLRRKLKRYGRDEEAHIMEKSVVGRGGRKRRSEEEVGRGDANVKESTDGQ